MGVNLVGYLDSILGIGEVARQVRAALEATGVAVVPFTLVADSADRLVGGPAERTGAPRHPVSLVCVNPEGLEGAHDELGEAFFFGRRTVGLWWWEVDAFPERLRRWFDLVDEVWVGSHHVADALAPISPVPILRMPMPVSVTPSSGAGRTELGVPPEGPVVLFAFDHGGLLERKNPLGLIDAFARAFAPGEGPSLVIKCIGAERHPEAHARLLAAAAKRPDVHVIERSFSPADMAALTDSCDLYASLHRSEGFGLTIAEAMLHGRPVMATAYSGPSDWLSERNAFPVDHELVPIGPGHEPYPPEGRWADPDLDHAAAQMRRALAEPEEARRRAVRGREDVARMFAPEAAGRA
ncbi:MAG: glycosyltransferase family 4 protein, partial [Actinomycetota bacterium]|nr:glycosyltransferase family 4 protein [Actinomycetota bacterium]